MNSVIDIHETRRILKFHTLVDKEGVEIFDAQNEIYVTLTHAELKDIYEGAQAFLRERASLLAGLENS